MEYKKMWQLIEMDEEGKAIAEKNRTGKQDIENERNECSRNAFERIKETGREEVTDCGA